VRGIRKEESDAILRLADALAGFVREALAGEVKMGTLLAKGKKSGYVKEV